MAEEPHRVRLDEIDWIRAFPVTTIFGSFRMALHPAKLSVALMAVVLIYLWGLALDGLFHEAVYPGELEAYHQLTGSQGPPDPLATAKEASHRQLQRMNLLPAATEPDQGDPFDLFDDARQAVNTKFQGQFRRLEAERDGKLIQSVSFDKPALDELQTALDKLQTARGARQLPQRLRQALAKASLSDEAEVTSRGNQTWGIVDQTEAYTVLQAGNTLHLYQLRPVTDKQRLRFEQAADRLYEQRRAQIAQIRQIQPQGTFAAALAYKLACLNELVRAAASLNIGLSELVPSADPVATAGGSGSIIDAVRKLLLVLPGWLCRYHLGFMLVFAVGAYAVWALAGGAIGRMAALHATRDDRPPIKTAVQFAWSRWIWFFLAPLIIAAFGLFIAAMMALGGLVMNVYVLDIASGLMFFLALIGGVLITLLAIGLVGGFNLLYPAIAVEGTDAFDAITRAFNYVLGRPWRMLLYNGAALVYGAVTYLFLSVVVYITLLIAHTTVNWGFFRQHYAVDQFDAIMPSPVLGSLVNRVDWYMLDWSGKVAAALTHAWVWLLVAGLVAYGISYYFSASTWVYLLLRRAADSVEYDDVYVEQDEVQSAPATTESATASATATDSGQPGSGQPTADQGPDQPPKADEKDQPQPPA